MEQVLIFRIGQLSVSWQQISGTRIICLQVNLSALSSSGYVGVIPGNACGNSSTMTPITYSLNQNRMSGNLKTSMFEVYPNPASGDMVIQSNNAVLSDKSFIHPEIREVRIVNKMGIIQYSKKFDKGITSATISVNGLLTDVYTLMIYDGSQWNSQQITIQR